MQIMMWTSKSELKSWCMWSWWCWCPGSTWSWCWRTLSRCPDTRTGMPRWPIVLVILYLHPTPRIGLFISASSYVVEVCSIQLLSTSSYSGYNVIIIMKTIIIICVRCDHHHDDDQHHPSTMRSTSSYMMLIASYTYICIRCDQHARRAAN